MANGWSIFVVALTKSFFYVSVRRWWHQFECYSFLSFPKPAMFAYDSCFVVWNMVVVGCVSHFSLSIVVCVSFGCPCGTWWCCLKWAQKLTAFTVYGGEFVSFLAFCHLQFTVRDSGILGTVLGSLMWLFTRRFNDLKWETGCNGAVATADFTACLTSTTSKILRDVIQYLLYHRACTSDKCGNEWPDRVCTTTSAQSAQDPLQDHCLTVAILSSSGIGIQWPYVEYKISFICIIPWIEICLHRHPNSTSSMSSLINLSSSFLNLEEFPIWNKNFYNKSKSWFLMVYERVLKAVEMKEWQNLINLGHQKTGGFLYKDHW